jgi:hypothetical protein
MAMRIDTTFIKRVSTDAAWKAEVLAAPRRELVVVEVFCSAFGHCDGLDLYWRNLHCDHVDQLGLKFVRAECDGVHDLRRFVGRSRPTVLFFLGGIKVGRVNGARPHGPNGVLELLLAKAPRLSRSATELAGHVSESDPELYAARPSSIFMSKMYGRDGPQSWGARNGGMRQIWNRDEDPRGVFPIGHKLLRADELAMARLPNLRTSG